MFISYYVCLKCRGRVVTNVVRTCDPTPLLYIFGNKICLNYKTRAYYILALCLVVENGAEIDSFACSVASHVDIHIYLCG